MDHTRKAMRPDVRPARRIVAISDSVTLLTDIIKGKSLIEALRESFDRYPA